MVRAQATVGRRGPVLLTSVRVSTTFPFGLFVKSRDLEVTDELLVLPARVPGAARAARARRRAAGSEQKQPPRPGRRGRPRPAPRAPGGRGRPAHPLVEERAAGHIAAHRARRAAASPASCSTSTRSPGRVARPELRDCSPPGPRRCSAGGPRWAWSLSGGFSLRPATGALQARAILRALARAGHGAAAVKPERLRLVLRDLAASAAFGAMAVSGQVPAGRSSSSLLALGVALAGQAAAGRRAGERRGAPGGGRLPLRAGGAGPAGHGGGGLHHRRAPHRAADAGPARAPHRCGR